MRLAIAAVLGLVISAGIARAATVTLDFNELTDPNNPSSATIGNVTYNDQNRYLYGNLSPFLVLGDDGFTASTSFVANQGTYFTPVSVDLSGYVNLLRAPCPGCTPSEIQDLQDICSIFGDCSAFQPYTSFGFLNLYGYRNGQLVASQSLGAGTGSYSGTFTFSSLFAGISSLGIGLNYLPPGGFPNPDSFAYACGSMFFSGCLGGSVDNLTVMTFQPPGGSAAVPLPAAGAGLALGLGALAALRRKRRGNRA